MNNPMFHHQQINGEVDFFTLLRDLWEQRLLVFSVTAVATFVAVAYAYISTPYYRVESVIRMASLKDLDELNGSELYSLTPKEALLNVSDALQSYSLRMKFFQANSNLYRGLQKDDEPLERSVERFNREGISMLGLGPKKGDDETSYQGISLTYPKGLNGVAIVNGLVLAAIEQERQRVQDDFNVILSNRLVQLQNQISTERARYEADKEARIASLAEADQLKRAQLQDELRALRKELQLRRQNRIKMLDEAIHIAESLEIYKPTMPFSFGDNSNEFPSGVTHAEVTSRQFPLYFMGSETLRAERSALQSRRSDDFVEPRIAEIYREFSLLEKNRRIEIIRQRDNVDLFFRGLLKLRGEQIRLENIKLDLSNLKLVRVDQPAIEYQEVEGGRKFFVILVGVMFGFVFGCFAAVLRAFILRKIGFSKVL
ncbi:Wzz/FepE/Etk N-terminal domain-containing protein [Pseudomonas sp. zfem003]|uniref:Wzz/FepE/Etk N-terminal domain-containing protein n=1 Tax=Pseudomonas sp. zfem003 TaxID=3078198 RepID=UPI00292A342F|nr:Wzz/FepE/Etk N-terminal domain-containing protein [Pseudomonas sp. zfem003]MDU9397876.1 Wzz/FepE/Etk N-terminal domain-containing protein [Pseudomonas sp. zfem003]